VIQEDVIHFILHFKYIGLFILLMLGLIGLPIPDEVLLVFVGFLITQKKFALIPSAVTAFLGSVVGMSFSFLIGRKISRPIIQRYGRKVGITPKRLAKIQDWFQRYGKWTVTLCYFIPGFRHLVSYFAGFSQFRYPSFAFYAGIGGMIWVFVFLGIGMVLGKHWPHFIKLLHEYTALVLILATFGVISWWILKKRGIKQREG
jgi:membrane protein DedA with SNARE-associated domain